MAWFRCARQAIGPHWLQHSRKKEARKGYRNA